MGFDVFEIFRSLVKESVSFKSYKAMHPVLATLSFIVLSPFIVLYAAMLIVYLVMATIYKLIHSAFDYLYAFVHGEGVAVKPIAQAIIYLIGFPLLFAFKVIYSVLIYPIVFFHFFTSHVGYIATFGGIRYSPFMFEIADRDRKFPKHCLAAVIVFVALGLILFALATSFKFVAYEQYKAYMEDTILTALLAEMEEAKANDKITAEQWNEFASEYNGKKINAKNYLSYQEKYLGEEATKLWDIKQEVQDCMLIETIYLLAIAAYVLYVIFYVPIYSSVIKRRKVGVA